MFYAKAQKPDADFSMSGNKISVKTLDLNKSFSELSGQLNQIAEHFIKSWIEKKTKFNCSFRYFPFITVPIWWWTSIFPAVTLPHSNVQYHYRWNFRAKKILIQERNHWSGTFYEALLRCMKRDPDGSHFFCLKFGQKKSRHRTTLPHSNVQYHRR